MHFDVQLAVEPHSAAPPSAPRASISTELRNHQGPRPLRMRVARLHSRCRSYPHSPASSISPTLRSAARHHLQRCHCTAHARGVLPDVPPAFPSGRRAAFLLESARWPQVLARTCRSAAHSRDPIARADALRARLLPHARKHRGERREPAGRARGEHDDRATPPQHKHRRFCLRVRRVRVHRRRGVVFTLFFARAFAAIRRQEVRMERASMTVLAPCAEMPPSKFMLLGTLKWME